jgi:hypothetical protein
MKVCSPWAFRSPRNTTHASRSSTERRLWRSMGSDLCRPTTQITARCEHRTASRWRVVVWHARWPLFIDRRAGPRKTSESGLRYSYAERGGT